jgi:GT2 family glycosyltransferase
MSLVSAIILNWNGKQLLADCLDTLQRQTRPADEILVVDNGSVDGSQEMVRERYPDVTLIGLDKNKGFSVANNIGIRRAHGDYIAVLNNDLLLDSGWIEHMAAALDADPSLGSCACKMLFYDRRNVINTAGDNFLTTGVATNRGMGQPDGETFQVPAQVFGACAGAAMYRATMFHDIGLFDEDLFVYFEDVDLSFRAQLAGYNCLYVPMAVAYHHHSVTYRSAKCFSRKDYVVVRNPLLVLVKDLPTPLLFRYLPFLVIGQLPFAFQMGMKGYVRAYTRARLDALRLVPRMLRKRRDIQRRARRRPEEIAARLTHELPS